MTKSATRLHPSTKIICTLGPTCRTEKDVLALAKAGMSIARINMSHGAWEDHRETVRMLQRINDQLRKEKGETTCVGIMLDTKGAEVRTGVVEQPIPVKVGEQVVFSFKPKKDEKRKVITVNHEHFAKDVAKAENILLDNGKMSFALVKIERDGTVVARSLDDGFIGSRRHVNLPGADLQMDSVTDKDWEDIAHGASEGVDFLALSFIRTAEEIEEVRSFLKKKGKSVALIAKIETRQAVENMHEIVDAADGIMVARGDLGAEVPFERIPVIQDELVALCREAGKPVTVATHMLESMINDPMPTRAEVTDIAHAATSGTDTTMLSGETASGKHPFKALDAMMRVLRATEEHLTRFSRFEDALIRSPRDARAEAAVTLALSSDADALIVMSKSGQSARDVSRFRPKMPIIAFVPNEQVQRAVQIHYGVIPLVVPFDDRDPEKTVLRAFDLATAKGILRKKQKCVVVSDSKAHDLHVSTVQIRSVL